MAIKYARLWDPVNQFSIKSGQLNVAGRVFVRLEATDDFAQIFDENGSAIQQPIILDNNGRSRGVFVDSAKTYWIDVQDRYGMSLFTVRKMTPCGGGGGSSASACEVVSSDGTIKVEKSVDGGVTTFDVSVADDSVEALDWIRCDGSDRLTDTDTYKPIYASGTMQLGEKGIILGEGKYYHVTAHVKATKGSVSPFCENVQVKLKTLAGETVTDIVTTDNLVDYSLGLSQDFEVSADVYSADACELLFDIVSEGDATFEITDVAVHRVYSGFPQGGGSLEQVQSDWTEQNSGEPSYIKHKPDVKTVVAGDYISITEGTNTFTISANLTSVLAQISSLQEQVSNLQTTVASMSGAVTDIEGRYTAHGNTYNSMSHTINHVL